MQTFRVPIRIDDPDAAAKALGAAGMERQERTSPGGTGDRKSLAAVRVTVFFEAADAASAEARVREAVGDQGQIGPARPVGSPD